MRLWHGQQIHGTINPGQPPHILAFEIGRIGITQYLNGDPVLARVYKICDIKFCRLHTAFIVADIPAIDPHKSRGFDSFKIEQKTPVAPIFRHREGSQIGTYGIVFFGWIWRIGGKRLLHIAEYRVSESFQLPVRRHLDPVPVARVKIFAIKFPGCFLGIFAPFE